mmetsp:Transcript_7290/g.13447  ORF Transcript_7290/g.13447 Transcript_7290/m.13447 type:complete len:109 (-) Transcript_7290:2130-2456(-)
MNTQPPYTCFLRQEEYQSKTATWSNGKPKTGTRFFCTCKIFRNGSAQEEECGWPCEILHRSEAGENIVSTGKLWDHLRIFHKAIYTQYKGDQGESAADDERNKHYMDE